MEKSFKLFHDIKILGQKGKSDISVKTINKVMEKGILKEFLKRRIDQD